MGGSPEINLNNAQVREPSNWHSREFRSSSVIASPSVEEPLGGAMNRIRAPHVLFFYFYKSEQWYIYHASDWLAIAVIEVAPTGIASFVYSCIGSIQRKVASLLVKTADNCNKSCFHSFH